MKKNLTKLLALMMALALVFSLAACGGDDTTGDSSEANAGASNNAEETLDPADPDATVPSGEESTVEGQSGETQNDATTPNGDKVTTPGGKTDDPATTKANTDKGLTSSDKTEIIKFYKAAADKMTKAGKKQTLSLVGELTGEGAIAKLISQFSSNINDALSKNSSPSEGVPGAYSQIVAADLTSASAKSDGKYTTITMKAKEQTDTAKSSWDKGPVGHLVGVLGDVDKAITELGVPIKYQESNIKLNYKNASVTAKIDNNTGKIVSATWNSDIYIDANDITVAYILPIQRVKGHVNQKIVMPG